MKRSLQRLEVSLILLGSIGSSTGQAPQWKHLLYLILTCLEMMVQVGIVLIPAPAPLHDFLTWGLGTLQVYPAILLQQLTVPQHVDFAWSGTGTSCRLCLRQGRLIELYDRLLLRPYGFLVAYRPIPSFPVQILPESHLYANNWDNEIREGKCKVGFFDYLIFPKKSVLVLDKVKAIRFTYVKLHDKTKVNFKTSAHVHEASSFLFINLCNFWVQKIKYANIRPRVNKSENRQLIHDISKIEYTWGSKGNP